MRKEKQRGFTLVELIITLVVLGVLASLALPAMGDFLEKRRLVGAAEEIYNHIVFTRSEAIKQSTTMRISADDAAWCVGTRSGANNCDCTVDDPDANDACAITMDETNVLARVMGDGYQGIGMGHSFSNDILTFDGVRGLVTGTSGTATLTSPSGWELRVTTSLLGRVTICSPAGASYVTGYPEC